VIVVAAVIEIEQKFLVARRLRGTHLEGYWEFPGGKVREAETLEQALCREIREELNSGISDLKKIFQTSHAYPERTIDLHFFRGTLTSPPEPALGQELRWIARDEFSILAFPPADAELLAELSHRRL
jgi:8-oxo-dGTP diphosphatase